MSTSEVLDFIPEVHRRYRNLWIGVNLLGSRPEEIIELIDDLPIGGIWTDNAAIDEQSDLRSTGRDDWNATGPGISEMCHGRPPVLA